MIVDDLVTFCKSLGFQTKMWRSDSSKSQSDIDPSPVGGCLRSADEFRRLVKDIFSDGSQRLIVNYYMPVLQLPYPFGHFSPLAAYHEGDDRVLLLDVYPDSVIGWVKVSDLFRAMDTMDSDSKLNRGCMVMQIL